MNCRLHPSNQRDRSNCRLQRQVQRSKCEPQHLWTNMFGCKNSSQRWGFFLIRTFSTFMLLFNIIRTTWRCVPVLLCFFHIIIIFFGPWQFLKLIWSLKLNVHHINKNVISRRLGRCSEKRMPFTSFCTETAREWIWLRHRGAGAGAGVCCLMWYCEFWQSLTLAPLLSFGQSAVRAAACSRAGRGQKNHVPLCLMFRKETKDETRYLFISSLRDWLNF